MVRDAVPSTRYPAAIPCLVHFSLSFQAQLRHILFQETLPDVHTLKFHLLYTHMILSKCLSLSSPPIHSPLVQARCCSWCWNAAVRLGNRNPCPHGTGGRRQTASKIISKIYGILVMSDENKTKAGEELGSGFHFR